MECGEDVDNTIEEEVFDIGFEIELKYDVIFGVIVYSKRFWNSVGRVMPLYKNIQKEGIKVRMKMMSQSTKITI